MSERWRVFGLLLLCHSLVACGGKEPAEPEEEEVSSGGESPVEGEELPVEELEEEPEEEPEPPPPSPWGKTLEEQCKAQPPRELSSRVERAIRDGVRSVQDGDASSAERSFEKAVSLDVNAYPALYNLGVLADRRGDVAKALGFYRQALQAQPDHAASLRGIATIEWRRGNVTAALQTVEAVAQQHKTNLEVQALYSETLVRAKRYEAAWLAARAALKCDERFVPALISLVKASRAQGRTELADSILDQALEIDDKNAELHFLNGERLRDQPGRLSEAMEAYQKSVALRSDYVEARTALGIQLLAGGNYPEALKHFESVANLVPTLPEAHVNLGDIYRSNRRWTDAKRAYDKALELRQKLPQAHFGLGLLYMTSAGEYPGLEELDALQKSVDEFKTYRSQMGSKLAKDDQSSAYLADLDRRIKRTLRRIEREKEKARREAERAARGDEDEDEEYE